MSRILAVKMTALGDVAAALAHLEQISLHHAQDEVWLVTSPEARSLFEHHPRFRVRTLDRDRFLASGGVLQALRWVRGMRFDRIYDLQGNKVSHRLCRWSGAPERLGTQPHAVYTASAPGRWVRTIHQNVAERLDGVLALGGAPPPAGPGPVHVDEDDREHAARFRKEHGLEPGRYVLMHAGSSPEWPSKRWPASYFTRLMELMEDQGLKCVVAGSGLESDLNAEICRDVGVDAAGLLSFRQLYALARDAAFAVSNDSAPMHLFAQAGVPVFAFFGPTNKHWSHAMGQRENVLCADLPCSPCFQNKCPADKGHACMKNLTPDKVLDFIQRRLEE